MEERRAGRQETGDKAQLERLIEIAMVLEKLEDQTGEEHDEEKLMMLHLERKVIREQLIVKWGYADRTRITSFIVGKRKGEEDSLAWLCELCFTENLMTTPRCETCGSPRREEKSIPRGLGNSFRDPRKRVEEPEPAALKRRHVFEAAFFPQPIYCSFCHTFIREPTGKQGFVCTHTDCHYAIHAKCQKRALRLECVPNVKKDAPPPLKYVPPLSDKEGRVLMPLILGDLAIHSFGKIPDTNAQNFHDTKHLFPVGFRSTRVMPSIADPTQVSLYTCEILSDKDCITPRFSVTPADDPTSAEVATFPAAAWMKILKRIELKRGKGRVAPGALKTISGPEYFGLSHPTVIKLLQDLPNVDKCVATGYEMQRFYTANEEPLDPQDEQFVTIITSPNLALVNLICQKMDRRADFADVCQSLLDLFQYQSQDLRLILWTLEREISTCVDVATLFRGHTMGPKLISTYLMRHGSSYLSSVLKPIMDEIISSNKSMEIDPHRVSPDENMQANKQALIRAVKQIFLALIEQQALIPVSLRKLFFLTQEEVTKGFPMMAGNLSIVGGFFFLRFVCPMLIAPHSYGLVDTAVPARSLRSMVLISKVLQNLSNGVLFEKEGYMKFINPYIQENQARMTSFLGALCVVPLDEEIPPSFIARGEAVVAEQDYRAAISYLRAFCSKHQIAYSLTLDDEFESVLTRQSAY